MTYIIRIAAAGVAAVSVEAEAIVIYDGGTASDLPNPAWYARFDSDGVQPVQGNASAIVVGPNQILTTRHQSGGSASPNALFEIIDGPNAGVYKTVSETNLGANVDARVFTVSKLDNTPAGFSTFASVFTGPLLTYDVAIGGFGRQIGAPLGGGTGYSVTGSPNNNTYALLQGYNRIYDADLDGIPAYAPYQNSPFIFADFDGPSGTGLDSVAKLPFEASVAQYDSGGGWFVKDGATWKLIGLTATVTTPNTADFGDELGAIYLTPFASQIPEPASVGVIAVGMFALARRRR